MSLNFTEDSVSASPALPSAVADPPVAAPSPLGPSTGGVGDGDTAECLSDWSGTTAALGACFHIHVYGFACLYILTGLVSVTRLHRLYTFRAGRLMSGFHFKMNMHISTFIFSFLRAVVLCLDPYGSRCRVPEIVIGLLWSLAFPCLAVAFSLLLLVLLDTTKLYPNLICVNHRTLTLVVSTVLYTAVLVLKESLKHFLVAPLVTLFDVLSQVIFVVWSLVMMLGYLYVARKIRRSLRNGGSPIESEALRRFAGILSSCGSAGLVALLVQMVAAVAEYSLAAAGLEPASNGLAAASPWAWWCLQSALRGLESTMACLLMVVASRTDNRRHVQVAPGTNWDWPRMHGWSLEAAPARPGRTTDKPSPAITIQSIPMKPEIATP